MNGTDLIISPLYMWFPGNIYNQSMMQQAEGGNSARYCPASSSTPQTISQVHDGLKVSPSREGLEFAAALVFLLAFAVALAASAAFVVMMMRGRA